MSVRVGLDLDDVVYRALENTARARGLQVHKMIEAQLTRAVLRKVKPAGLRRTTDDDVRAWVLLSKRGWTDSRIARETGASQSVVSRHLRAAGCPKNVAGGRPSKDTLTALEPLEEAA